MKLYEKMNGIFRNICGKNKLSPKDIEKTIEEVKLALLQADVSLNVVDEIVLKVKNEANEYKLIGSLTKSQNIIKSIRKNLISIMENDDDQKDFSLKQRPSIILLVGLQGVGKTTTVAKIAKYLSKNYKTMVCSCDISRAAAVEQLKILADSINVPMFISEKPLTALEICKLAYEEACDNQEVLLIDSAGRSQINENLMDELVNIKNIIKPHEILLVIDSMLGQESVEIAKEFHQKLSLTGAILTKMDGDSRGGAALSIKHGAGVPIRFFCDGEKLDNFNIFHATRMVDRMLGMGDILTLIEKAEKNFDDKEAKKLEENFLKGRFTYDDFLTQIKAIKKMGSFGSFASMLPVNLPKNTDEYEKQIVKTVSIISSMTKNERNGKNILTYKRKARIANGSGTKINDVNKLVEQFEKMQKAMKMFANMKNFDMPGIGNLLKNKNLLSGFNKFSKESYKNEFKDLFSDE